MTPNDSIEILRAKWIDLEYDSIMTNSAGDFVWQSLQQTARNMTHAEFVESLSDQEVFDDPHS